MLCGELTLHRVPAHILRGEFGGGVTPVERPIVELLKVQGVHSLTIRRIEFDVHGAVLETPPGRCSGAGSRARNSTASSPRWMSPAAPSPRTGRNKICSIRFYRNGASRVRTGGAVLCSRRDKPSFLGGGKSETWANAQGSESVGVAEPAQSCSPAMVAGRANGPRTRQGLPPQSP